MKKYSDSAVVQVCPRPEAFAEWANQSLTVLNLPASFFLNDSSVPNSQNRVRNLIKNPAATRFGTVVRLQTELLNTAVRQGILLPPIPALPLEKLFDPTWDEADD